MAHKWNLYIVKQSLSRDHENVNVGREDAAWQRTVIAETRGEALDKCLPEIRATVPPSESQTPRSNE